MITRKHGYLEPRSGVVPDEASQLQENGHTVLEGVLDAGEVDALRSAVEAVFDTAPADGRPATLKDADHDMHRYAMLNRSAACQRAVGHPRVLETIEPLLGEDCHVIANTAWRNPPDLAGSERGDMWHIDAGPHIPRAPDVPWPDAIPYPVFVIGCHILLEGSQIEDGPTGVIPGSHKSGAHPPFDRLFDEDLTYGGQGCTPLLGRAGDVALFVSDVWHRRMPTREGERGRFFLQVHYGRRDIAQRLHTTAELHQASDEAIERAGDDRARTLIGLHPPGFYDG